MIKATELRIGNWVIVNHHLLKVDFIFGDLGIGLKRTPDDNLVPEWRNYLINPVPLTPEILEECGFEDAFGELYREIKTGIPLSFQNSKEGLFITDNTGQKIGQEIKSLHQLQNIYYDLTGEELEVDLH